MVVQAINSGNVPSWSLEDRLRKAREWAGMNQTELADALGVSRVHIGRLETGKVVIKRPMLMAWALASGVDFQWLETGHEKSPSPEGEGLSMECARRDSNPQPSDP
ncbi:helix-turn-helix domain-containing protein [Rothia sp. L_38]|uniref:helix-turn-helix domain-containing protein n=1 Tax=Rothia sp. L_38 TaxID=3422315 RepID=UPI003D6AB9BC